MNETKTPAVKAEPKTYTVNCPKCSTSLKVKDGNYAHICPYCSYVFRIRKGEKLVKDVSRVTMVEAYVNVDKDAKTGAVKTATIVKESK